MDRRAWRLGIVGFVGAALLGGGCGGGGGKPQPAGEANLQSLAVFYGRYQSQHRGQTPPDEAAFKKFVSEAQAGSAKSAPGSADDLFLSPRDKQPYVVRYNLPVGPPGPQGQPIVAYEQTGSGGKRYAVNMTCGLELLTTDQLRERVPDAK